MKIKAFAILAFTCLALLAQAQQEQQYTQFMFNKLGYNPAYAGSSDGPELVVLHRSQWLGLEGAPNGQAASYSHPMLNGRVGVGGNLARTQVGITTNTTFSLAYCYRIPVYKGVMGFGVQASLRQVRQNWADSRLQATQPILTDVAIPTDPQSKLAPNFGFGAYYDDSKFFVGISVPRLVQNNIDFAETGGILSREARTAFAMGGVKFPIAEGVELTAQTLLKYTKNTPFDADLNFNCLFQKRVLTGLTYRTGGGKTSAGGESLDLLAGVYITPKLFFALSYDIGLTKLRKFNNGSVEATVRFWLNPSEGVETQSPRDF